MLYIFLVHDTDGISLLLPPPPPPLPSPPPSSPHYHPSSPPPPPPVFMLNFWQHFVHGEWPLFVQLNTFHKQHIRVFTLNWNVPRTFRSFACCCCDSYIFHSMEPGLLDVC